MCLCRLAADSGMVEGVVMAGKFETRKGTSEARMVTIARREARRVKYANAR